MMIQGTLTLQTGEAIQFELYPEYAPKTVDNFVQLAKKGYYNGLTFHRVIPSFMIQGGCPKGDGTGGPGHTIPGEFQANGWKNPLKHTAGVFSMARTSDPNSAGSQFFITVAATPHLDNQYAAFGKVVAGFEHAIAISKVARDYRDRPRSDVRIQSIQIKEETEE